MSPLLTATIVMAGVLTAGLVVAGRLLYAAKHCCPHPDPGDGVYNWAEEGDFTDQQAAAT